MTTKRQPSLTMRIFFTIIWSWLLIVSTVRHLQMPDLGRWDWGKFTSTIIIAMVIFLVAHNITSIATGKYRREDAPKD